MIAKHIINMFVGISGSLVASMGIAQIDITQRVFAETALDEKIAAICARHCHGNRREGRLRRMHVERLDANTIGVTAFASLKNHHHQDTLIGGGFAVYNFTIDVHAAGILKLENCILTVRDIKVVNDRTGLLSGLVEGQEGKEHKIENCKSIVRGI